MRCVKIEYIENQSDLFDLEIEGGGNNYVANGIVVHNTFCGIGLLPMSDWDDKHFRGKFVVFSKGLGSQGLCFKDNDKNATNTYIQTLSRLGVFEKLESFIKMITVDGGKIVLPTYILGEVFGKGVQDLSYAAHESDFRVFDMVVMRIGTIMNGL